jgi:exopolysaccharide biosynthesis predicted pyruvyltransferase EpsI
VILHPPEPGIDASPVPLAGRLDLYGQTLARWLSGLGPLRLIVRMPGNIGDHLIWRGCCDLFDQHRIDAERIDQREALAGSHPDHSLVIPGSGALTRLWHEWLPELILKAARHYRNVIVLPSDYDVDVPVVAEALAQPNVWAFARQPRSYAAIRVFGRAALMPDPALWCRRFHDLEPPPEPCAEGSPGPLLLALRSDKGSCLRQLPYQPAPALNRDLSCGAPDLDAFLDAVACAAHVVTDRLHIAVAAVMLGKRLSWLDPYDGKISGYLAYAFDDSQLSRCGPIAIDALLAGGWLEPLEV